MKTNTNETPGDYLRRTLKDKDAMLEVARLATEDQRKAMTHNTRNTGAAKGTSGINLKGSTGASGNSPSAYGSAERYMTQDTKIEEVNYEVRDYDGIKWIRYDHYEHALHHQLQKAREERDTYWKERVKERDDYWYAIVEDLGKSIR